VASNLPDDLLGLPGASFLMGDAMDEGDPDYEQPVHAVQLSAFAIGRREVTKSEWDAVASWAATNGYDIGASTGSGKATNHPVHSVSWFHCVKWCNARSEKEGLSPCYFTDGGHGTVYRSGETDLQDAWVDWSAAGYRLPTEAEWECAARGAAAQRRFPWRDTNAIVHARANYFSSAHLTYDLSPTRGCHPDHDTDPSPYTAAVGSFAANNFGIHDAAGNVHEWCWDRYDIAFVACWNCGGNGWVPCPICEGAAWVLCWNCGGVGCDICFYLGVLPCDYCLGAGTLTCPVCVGTGELPEPGRYYQNSPGTNPRGPDSGLGRVYRGGDWWDYGDACRVAARRYGQPTEQTNRRGFRVVRRIP
jgi:formylglycine-generating enzyme required for sulfatase activity